MKNLQNDLNNIEIAFITRGGGEQIEKKYIKTKIIVSEG